MASQSLSLEQPVLWLGLAGFPKDLRARAGELLSARTPGWPVWRLREFKEADAWWVNGAGIQLMRDGTLKVAPGSAGDRSTHFNLAEVDRPIAFSTPLAAADFEPAYHFDLQSPASVRQVLQQFEAWLRPLRAQFALGAQIVRREPELKAAVYHVTHKGTLLAVVDLHQWIVGVLPTARPVDMDEASWDKRPAGANDIPAAFTRSTVTQVMWTYARRTQRDILPARYRTGPVYLRREPQVPAQWLKASHQWLLGALASGPSTFEALRDSSGMASAQLARDLASLYFAGALSSMPANASTTRWRAEGAPRDSGETLSAPDASPLGPESHMLAVTAARPSYVLGVRT